MLAGLQSCARASLACSVLSTTLSSAASPLGVYLRKAPGKQEHCVDGSRGLAAGANQLLRGPCFCADRGVSSPKVDSSGAGRATFTTSRPLKAAGTSRSCRTRPFPLATSFVALRSGALFRFASRCGISDTKTATKNQGCILGKKRLEAERGRRTDFETDSTGSLKSQRHQTTRVLRTRSLSSMLAHLQGEDAAQTPPKWRVETDASGRRVWAPPTPAQRGQQTSLALTPSRAACAQKVKKSSVTDENALVAGAALPLCVPVYFYFSFLFSPVVHRRKNLFESKFFNTLRCVTESGP